ncbi:hypothetical protein NDU88_009927 [Pleurodeles waltl]|uniref:Uncharacterized protein n=1 Tax=Pleurodeles waltl TaxID=8319 RepID=A0AAV7RXN8_PLEWA|nr:hypothetical protein NDU88_009927 [Pleurodeles waltl]
MSADARCPAGISGPFFSNPEVFSPSPRNNRWPDGGGVFKSPDTLTGGTPPDPRSEMTKEGPTATVKEETTTPGASYGGDEQEAAGP